MEEDEGMLHRMMEQKLRLHNGQATFLCPQKCKFSTTAGFPPVMMIPPCTGSLDSYSIRHRYFS